MVFRQIYSDRRLKKLNKRFHIILIKKTSNETFFFWGTLFLRKAMKLYVTLNFFVFVFKFKMKKKNRYLDDFNPLSIPYLKVVQLHQLLEVRHSVFIIGNAGTGKTQVWRCLQRTLQNRGDKPVVSDLNPKAVTTDELFGVINPATREWKDGMSDGWVQSCLHL